MPSGAWEAADVGELVPLCAHGPVKGQPKKPREAA